MKYSHLECSNCFKRLTDQQERRLLEYCSLRCQEVDQKEIADYHKWVNDRKAELPEGAIYWSVYSTLDDSFCIEWGLDRDRTTSQITKWRKDAIADQWSKVLFEDT